MALIMTMACATVTAATITVLYRTALREQKRILEAFAWNYAQLINGIAEFDTVQSRDFPGGSGNATLSQIAEAHKHFKGMSSTGEIMLGKREGDRIVFLLGRLDKNADAPAPVPMNSKLAKPMQMALLGRSGSMMDLDYRGVMVFAAYEPVPALNWGVVVKIDLDEVRDPFIKAGILALEIAGIVVLIGSLVFIRLTNPIITRLREHALSLTKLVTSLRQSEEDLRKARDQLEIRVQERTEELSAANTQLSAEVHVRARAEERLRALWFIAGMTDADAEVLCDHILHYALQMTQSKYAFYGFLSPDESVMSIYSWSREVSQDCRISEKPLTYSIESAGIWADAIRQRRDLIVNDYPSDNACKLGTPEGHVTLTRIISIPVFNQGRIVAIVVAANKETDYDDEDVKQLRAFASGVQMIIDQREMDKALRESEEACRLLSRQVIEAQEKERKRFARDIHDGIGQSLAAIKYRIESNALKADRDAPAAKKEFQSVIQMIRDTMEEVRRIQNDLRPAYLDVMGLLETISDFCEKFQTTYASIKTDLQLGLSEEDIPEYLKTPIFRILQESMNNAARHSDASQVIVSIRKAGDKIELEVEDNGAGMALKEGSSQNTEARGLGLYSMKERAKLSGGSLQIKSSPGQGTAIGAAWPIAAKGEYARLPDTFEI